MVKGKPVFIVIIIVAICSTLMTSCGPPLIQTTPEIFTDTSEITITCNANRGNKGIRGYEGPVYVHLGLITDRSRSPNDWRYVKFYWGSTEAEARAKPIGNNRWTYKISNIRRFFDVDPNEKILKIALLFRSGNCIDINCKVLRSYTKGDLFIPIPQ